MTSYKVTLLETSGEVRAGSQVSKITEPDEHRKRRRQSKSKRAKTAAKVKKEHSPRSSLPPEEDDEEDEDEEGGFAGLQGLTPDPQVRSAFAEMTRLNKGYKASSESARSRGFPS